MRQLVAFLGCGLGMATTKLLRGEAFFRVHRCRNTSNSNMRKSEGTGMLKFHAANRRIEEKRGARWVSEAMHNRRTVERTSCSGNKQRETGSCCTTYQITTQRAPSKMLFRTQWLSVTGATRSYDSDSRTASVHRVLHRLLHRPVVADTMLGLVTTLI